MTLAQPCIELTNVGLLNNLRLAGRWGHATQGKFSVVGVFIVLMAFIVACGEEAIPTTAPPTAAVTAAEFAP